MPRQRIRVRIDTQVIGVGTLVVAGARLLSVLHHRRRTLDQRAGQRARQLPLAIGPLVIEVETPDVGARAEQVLECRVAQIAVDGGATQAEDGLSAPEIAPNAADEIVGHGLDGRRCLDVRAIYHPRRLLGGESVEYADCPGSDFAGQLTGADDGAGIGSIDELAVDETLRWTADSPGIKDLLISVARAAVDRANVEDVGALHEERPLLGKERL